MVYPKNFEEKIGFDKIRQKLKQYCLSSLGTDLADAMTFQTSVQYISEAIDRVEEYRQIEFLGEEIPLENVIDCRLVLERLMPEGTYAEADQMHKLQLSLETIKKLYHFFKRHRERFPMLWQIAEGVKLFPYIESRFENIFTPQGKIRDGASERLMEIRRESHRIQAEISKRMHRLLEQCKNEGITEEGASLAIRDGRLVLPVLSTFKRRIKGFIYDESATGKTTFIEPSDVVELNNDLKELELAERREIIKILTQLADDIRPYLNDLLSNYNFLAEIDFIQAKAQLAKEINAVKPSIVAGKPVIDWYEAVHPLLYLHLKNEGKKVVPLNIRLNEQQRILVISGPNAGGKSVCLKTVGLLQYMFQCGLPIPLKPTSDAGVFQQIFIDIGDEQSIEDDLSTYSSHLIHMKFFIKNANAQTLFLIDELGAGTEPTVGGAIAESVLEELNQLGAYGVVTTHFSNLKHFASSTPGLINGAMLFDMEQLTPLFQLFVGEPGSSFAFEIARKIGLPEPILKRASEKVGSGYIEFDRSLRQIIRDKHYWQQKRAQVKESARKLESIIERYGHELEDINKLRKEIISQAKSEALQIIQNANKTIENTIRTIKEAQADKEKTKNARNELNQIKKDLENLPEDEARILNKISKLKEREERKKRKNPPIESSQPKESKPTEDKHSFGIGDKVRIVGQNTIGEVLEVSEKSVLVAFGNMITTLPHKRIEKVSTSEYKKITKHMSSTSTGYLDQLAERRRNFKLQLDVRGMRTQEAIEQVADYIDDAIMLGISEVKILHGKGNGILRQMIREYLKTVDMVEDFHDEHVEFGGAGITVVKIA
ncbi:MAG: Smr/MutS family protein [Bacteroidales bacterium]|nr:Smr/MutS family protein [Bacteroidales bacterium]